MANVNYKRLKEDFVSNLSGGSVTEISHVVAVSTVWSLRWIKITPHMANRNQT